MAKFIVGVLVGLFFGASASAYGAVATGTLSKWMITSDGVEVCSSPNTSDACGRNSGSHSGRVNLSR
jgi:hypothetical protein